MAVQEAHDDVAAQRACPVCGGARSDPVAAYSRAPWRLARCRACGFVYLANPPAYAALDAEHAWEVSALEERARRRREQPVVSNLDRMTRWRLKSPLRTRAARLVADMPHGRVLDVGCGARTMVPEPYVPYGIEISAALVEKAAPVFAARGGEIVHAPAVEGIARFPDGFFSGVLLRSFLEHEADPGGLLAQAARVLAGNGAVYVRVPNYGSVNRRVMGAKWCGFRHPDHVNYFSLATLSRLAAASGFRVRLKNRLTLPFDDNIKAVLVKA